MKRILQISAVLLLAAALAVPAVAGNSQRTGTAGAQELRIPVGTRGIALAGATAASSNGIESIYYNPAGLGSALRTEAYFGHTEYLADMKVRYFALATPQSIGVIGITAKVLDLGDLYVTTEDAPDGTGQIESITFAVLGLTFARYMTDAVAFGGSVQFVSENIMNVSARGFAFDLGLQYNSNWRGAKLGVAMKNVGPNMRFSGSDFEYTLRLPGDDPQAANRTVSSLSSDFELPSYLQIGVEVPAWRSGEHAFTVAGAFQSNNFSQDEGRGGVEYAWKDLLMLRGGYAYTDQDNYLFGPTFGAGLILPVGGGRVHVDYALQTVDSFFDDLHTFSARVAF